ncbi:MAG: thiaminase II, partial [Calditrichae bacterium]|nr:thiaminase II [Calditrichia bacterium]
NWTSQEFQQYVEWLATTLDELVEGKSESELEDLKELFLKIAKYEYLFWEMAVKEEEWPV